MKSDSYAGNHDLVHRIEADLLDGYDETLELELEDGHLDELAELDPAQAQRRREQYTKEKESMHADYSPRPTPASMFLPERY